MCSLFRALRDEKAQGARYVNMTIPLNPSSRLYTATEGEFAGWTTWTSDSFETHNGPFWHRIEADNSVRCAFRVEQKHMNGQRSVHGGCYMTFADYCLFAFARPYMEGTSAVTIAFSRRISRRRDHWRTGRGNRRSDPRRRLADFRARQAACRQPHRVHLLRHDQAGEEAAGG